MADSIWVRAWERTEFKGFKRTFGSLALAFLNLFFTYEANLRPLHATLVFMGCAIAAYVAMTAIEFFGYAAFFKVQDSWQAFLAGLKQQILTDVKEATKAVRPPPEPEPRDKPDRHLPENQKALLVEYLKARPGKVLMLSQMGIPESYRYALEIRDVFKLAGWETRQALSSLQGQELCFLYREHEPNTPTSFACAAFVAAGIAYVVRRREGDDQIPWNECTLLVGDRD